ncbi:MAG: hypothetical protein R3A46_15150 [Thermomicrobiales bacterium]
MAGNRSSRETLGRLTIPRLETIGWFIFGATVLGVSGSAAYDLARVVVGTDAWALAIILVLSVLLLYGLAFVVEGPARRILNTIRSDGRLVFQEETDVARRRALVVMASLKPGSEETAIKHHLDQTKPGKPLEYCWAIYSDASAQTAVYPERDL